MRKHCLNIQFSLLNTKYFKNKKSCAAGIRWITLILLSCFLFSCSGFNTSGQILDEKTYEKLFIELAILNLLDETDLPNGSSREELRETILDSYGVTEQQFNTAHEFYEANPAEQMERLNRINEMLREERNALYEAEQQARRPGQETPDSLQHEPPDLDID